jgi:glutaredoxin
MRSSPRATAQDTNRASETAERESTSTSRSRSFSRSTPSVGPRDAERDRTIGQTGRRGDGEAVRCSAPPALSVPLCLCVSLLRETALASGAVVATIVTLIALDAHAQSVRDPYLQMGTPDGMSIVWRTAASGPSSVCWGEDRASLTNRATGPDGIDHVVRVTGLSPSTTYYYAVSPTCPVAGDADHTFRTSPPTGSRTPFRLWVVGDSGTGGTRQRAVFSAMLEDVGADTPDVFLHMGDIAYDSGTTTEFDANFFDIYESLLMNTPCWPTLGNHEGRNADSLTQTGPYYEAYVLPPDGAAGGMPSGTEAYYSFDYANVHFIVLDSHDSPRTAGGPMLTWLRADLAATDQEWVVAYWHHPPYTDGTHTDVETQLREMRENVNPILEAAGVDVVLAGHSHIYERSYLLHGAYTSTVAAGHIVDMGDGRTSGDGPYRATGDGALYVVAGHGGASVGGDASHPLMYVSEVAQGSCIVDVTGPAMTLHNLRWDGVETDDVTLVRDSTSIVLLSPAGGETYLAGSEVDIVWASSGASGRVRVDFSVDDGATWNVLATDTADDGHHAWRTPRFATARARVRVTDIADEAITGQSLAFTLAAETVITAIPSGSVWAYHDQGVDQGDAWRTSLGGWASGPAELGYGDADEETVLTDFDPNAPTYYFRREVVVDGEVTSARARVLFDDGFVMFVNGTEVSRQNVGGLAFDAFASGSSGDNARYEADIDASVFREGSNVVAVMVKQDSGVSSDLSFDLTLELGVRVEVEETLPDAGVPGDRDGGRDVDSGMVAPGSDAGPPDVEDGGCGCRAAPRGGSPFAIVLCAALALVYRRRAWLLPLALLLSACSAAVPPASASQRAQVRITMYTTSWCPACASARSWLHSRGIPFDDYDVEVEPEAAARHRHLNSSRSVPTIDVEGTVIRGWSAEDLRNAVDRAAHRYR